MRALNAMAVAASLLGTVWAIGRFTDGNVSLMLFGLAAWSLLVYPLLLLLGRVLSLQHPDRQMLENNLKRCQSRHLPYSRKLTSSGYSAASRGAVRPSSGSPGASQGTTPEPSETAVTGFYSSRHQCGPDSSPTSGRRGWTR